MTIIFWYECSLELKITYIFFAIADLLSLTTVHEVMSNNVRFAIWCPTVIGCRLNQSYCSQY